MDKNELIDILSRQKQSITEVIDHISNDSTLTENQELKAKVSFLNKKVDYLEAELQKIKTVNTNTTLNQSNISNKINFIDNEKNKLLSEFEKQLDSFEYSYLENIKANLKMISTSHNKEFEDVKNRLIILGEDVKGLVKDIRTDEETLRQTANQQLNNKKAEINSAIIIENQSKPEINQEIKAEVTPTIEPEIKKEVKQENKIKSDLSNLNFELKFGSKITSIVGILLIMIAITYGAYLTYSIFGKNLSDAIKLLAIYAIGGLLIGASEFFKNKTSKSFHTVLLGGGIGVLYLATTIGYFIFEGLLSGGATLIIIALISAISFYLSFKNDIETISIFAIIGGYLPLVDLISVNSDVTGLVFYTLALSSFAMFISMKREWKALKYVTFGMNFVTTVPLMLILIDRHTWNFALIFIYALATIFICLITTIYYPIKHQKQISIYEKIVFVLNITFNTGIIIYLSWSYIYDFIGYVIFALAIIYFILAKKIEKSIDYKLDILNYLYTISASFALFAVIPQFEENIVYSLLIIESTAMIICTIYYKNEVFEYVGKFCLVMLTLVLVFNKLIFNEAIVMNFFDTYDQLVLAYIAILGTLYYKNKDNLETLPQEISNTISIIKTSTLILIYFNIYFTSKEVFTGNYFGVIQGIPIMFVLLLSIFNIIILNIKYLKDNTLPKTTLIASSFAFCFLIYDMLSFRIILAPLTLPMFILAIFFINIYMALRQLKMQEENRYIFAIFLSYVLIMITVMYYGKTQFTSFLVTLPCLVASLVGLFVGFRKNTANLRKIMLGAIYLFLAKIFFLDFRVTNSVERVITLFLFGILLILISYFYHKFAARIIEELNAPKIEENQEQK